MQVEGYDIDIVVQGFPGKTVCHGGLGWSTVVLIRGHGKVAMIDTGNFNVRSLLIDGLKKHGLKPADLTDLLLTHAHWDHCVNWTLFPEARIVIGAHEIAWAVKEPWGETPVPELYSAGPAVRDSSSCSFKVKKDASDKPAPMMELCPLRMIYGGNKVLRWRGAVLPV